MTQQEFKKVIKSFNKAPGTYTQDELLAIGIAHKDLPQTNKDWKGLVEVLGVNKAPKVFSQWVYDKLKYGKNTAKAYELLQKAISQIKTYPEELDNTKLAADMEKANEKLEQLFIERTRTQDVYNAYKRTLRDEARIISLKECIAESISNLATLTPINFKPYEGSTSNKKEAILLLSDLHIGVDCSNFYNTYNIEIAKKRVAKVVEDTIAYCKENKVKRLNCLNLGDLIHGSIHVSARIEQEVDVISQVMIAAEVLSEALNRLQLAAPEVIYRSVVDNHSRVVANKEEHIEKENLNRLIDWFVEERLKNSSIKFMHDNIDEGIGKFNLLNGKLVIFAHGHQDQKNTVLQAYVGALREFVDYICIGHFHSPAAKSFQDCRVFVNGSVVGTEQYALSKRLFNKPSQKLLIFDTNNNVLDIDIILDINE